MPVSRGVAAVLTAIAVIVLVGGTAIFIESYGDREAGDLEATVPTQATVSTQVTTPAAAPPSGAAPVGGVATGGGGTAGDAAGVALPVLGGLAVLTLAAAGGVVVLRRRTA